MTSCGHRRCSATPIRSGRWRCSGRAMRCRPRTGSGSTAWQVRSPVVKFNAALYRLPTFTGRAAARRGRTSSMISVTPGLDAAQAAFEACVAGRAAVGLRRGVLPDRVRPDARAGGQAPDERVRAVRAVHVRRRLLVGRQARGGRAPVHRPHRAVRARHRRLHRALRGARPARHRGAHRAHRRPHLPGRDDARPDVGAPAHRPHAGRPGSTSAARPPTRPAASSRSTAATPRWPSSTTGASDRLPTQSPFRRSRLDGG